MFWSSKFFVFISKSFYIFRVFFFKIYMKYLHIFRKDLLESLKCSWFIIFFVYIYFFYKKRFDRTDEENDNHPDWFATFYFATSWDKPEDWSGKNIVVAVTEKGKKYLNEILAPKFYEKYKDVEIYLDDEGNIIGSNADTAIKA